METALLIFIILIPIIFMLGYELGYKNAMWDIRLEKKRQELIAKGVKWLQH